MGKRKRRLGSQTLERVAFVVLLGLVAALLVASTRLDDDEGTPPTAAAPGRPEVLRSAGLTAAISDSAVIPASSAAGRRRDRVRVALAVTLTNSSSKEVSARRALRLEYSGRVLQPDRAATGPQVLDLRTPVEPGATRRGEVRFELSGADTRALRNRADARVILVAPAGRRDGVTLELDVPS